MKIEYEVMKLARPYLIDEKEYEIIKVKDTVFRCFKGDFEKFVVNQTDEHWNKVNEWIDSCLMPYMTRKSTNYMICSSYGLKHHCEKLIGEYVSNDEIKYLLAMRGIKGEDKSERYPINLYYPLSSAYSKQSKKDLEEARKTNF